MPRKVYLEDIPLDEARRRFEAALNAAGALQPNFARVATVQRTASTELGWNGRQMVNPTGTVNFTGSSLGLAGGTNSRIYINTLTNPVANLGGGYITGNEFAQYTTADGVTEGSISVLK